LLSRAFHQSKYQDDSILLFPTVNWRYHFSSKTWI